LQWALEAARLMSPMLLLETANVWIGVAILVGAGLWQLTPLKTMCLRHCRSPLGFLMNNWRAGRIGALRMGLEHGALQQLPYAVFEIMMPSCGRAVDVLAPQGNPIADGIRSIR
jgi:Predicted metal-binding integral membrane protein (DUF2182)